MKTRRSDHPRRRIDAKGKLAISRLPLHEQVADEIRQMIISRALVPGEKVRVSELAEDMEVSLTPMREALKVLAKENLVELIANRGARVSEITVEGTRSLFEVISRLEALAAELAATRITASQLKDLEEMHARMKDHHAREELQPYFNLNRKVHDLVVEAANNPDLTRVRTSLAFHVERARFLSVATPGHRDRSVRDHDLLVEALRARDPRAAHDAWQTHLERAGEESCRLVALWKENHETTAVQ